MIPDGSLSFLFYDLQFLFKIIKVRHVYKETLTTTEHNPHPSLNEEALTFVTNGLCLKQLSK